VVQPPAGRYGRERTTTGRPAWIVPAVIASIAAAALIAWLGIRLFSDPVQWQDVGFSITGPESIDVTFQVTKDPGATVRCQVKALNKSFAEVGVLPVDVGPSSGRAQRVTATVRTAELAVTGTVDSCSVVAGP
jgi:hypothetical protein